MKASLSLKAFHLANFESEKKTFIVSEQAWRTSGPRATYFDFEYILKITLKLYNLGDSAL